jgi:hypothetical protein
MQFQGGIVEIESSIIFKRLSDSYLLSLGYFRTLIMLDQCHDFCETSNRNKWISGRSSLTRGASQGFTKDYIINSIRKTYIKDMNFIKDKFSSSEPLHLPLFQQLKDFITSDVVRQHLKSTHGIRDKILKGGLRLEQNMGITSANLYDYVDKFKCSEFSKYLASILSSGQSNSGAAILGVDATKNNAGYSAVFTNMCDIINSPDVPEIAVLKSPATDYDAAGTSGVSNFIVSMIAKAGKRATVLGQSNPGVNSDYIIRVTAREIPFIDFTYKVNNEAGDDNYISCTINSFFSQGKTEPWIQKPDGTTVNINSRKIQGGGTQNSVAYLTENFSPDDNIYLFKTIGDLGQALSFKIESQKYPSATNFYLTFDYLSGLISSLFNPGTLLEDTGNAISPLTIFTLTPNELSVIKRLGASVPDIAAAQQLMTMQQLGSVNKFGRKTNKLRSMSNEELKTKLKSVDINVTKISSKGKRLNLTRKEMEKKALLFKNLQLRAKKMGIKIMYKSRTRGYMYKSYTRLMNELEKLKQMKMKTNTKFG